MWTQVNVLTHIAELKLKSEHLSAIDMLKRKHFEQDKRELLSDHDGETNVDKVTTIPESDLSFAGDGSEGALWDIFRRQDELSPGHSFRSLEMLFSFQLAVLTKSEI
ncbi:hypothetical protein V8G54_029512 [Vigna mungo]|uniref:Uncharacterized protein n=1 Tax=Vigna mungo TaxID=3915 RepID=A0AAQ3RKE0_VIGMU